MLWRPAVDRACIRTIESQLYDWKLGKRNDALLTVLGRAEPQVHPLPLPSPPGPPPRPHCQLDSSAIRDSLRARSCSV